MKKEGWRGGRHRRSQKSPSKGLVEKAAGDTVGNEDEGMGEGKTGLRKSSVEKI